jgi:hypothetical protein
LKKKEEKYRWGIKQKKGKEDTIQVNSVL